MSISTSLLVEFATDFQFTTIGDERVVSIRELIAQSNAVIAHAAEQRLVLDDNPASYACWAAKLVQSE
jgi:hypothetical protein